MISAAPEWNKDFRVRRHPKMTQINLALFRAIGGKT
jgi:hypothetical protein